MAEKKTVWYQNKSGYKKAGIDISHLMTPERIKEIIRCKTDCHYFIETYCKIKTRDKNPITGLRINPFKLRKYQAEQVDLYLKHRFVALAYPRRSGKTSGTVAYFAWCMLFECNFTIICLANRDESAMEIIEQVKLMFKELPFWLQQGVIKMTDHKFKLENGSNIIAQATTIDAGRSAGANILYLDEVAYIPRNIWKPFYSAVYPVITDGETTQLIATSTADGLNHWWKIYNDSTHVNCDGSIKKKGINQFVLKEIKWNEVPGRDEAFKKRTIADIGQRAWDAEYENKFLGSAGTLLSTAVLENLCPVDPIKTIEIYKHHYELKIYELSMKISKTI